MTGRAGKSGKRPKAPPRAVGKAVTLRAPTWLPAAGKKCWKETVQALESLGTLRHVDAGSLELYCLNYSQWRAAVEEGDAKTQREAERVLLWMRKQYGLTWAARKSLQGPQAAENPVDGWLSRIG